jgi:hypothetical protein
MAPSAAVDDVYLARGAALKMPPRLKVCRAFELIFAARPVCLLLLLLLLLGRRIAAVLWSPLTFLFVLFFYSRR